MTQTLGRAFHASESLPENFRLPTRNLDLIPATTKELSAPDRDNISRLLDAKLPAEWPPEPVMESSSSSQAEWWNWYVLKRDKNLLIGLIGLKGWPDSSAVQIGCSLVPQYQKKGHGSEAFEGVTNWVLNQPNVNRIITETPTQHEGAIKLLRNLGYTQIESNGPAYLWFGKSKVA